ncbi:unnamed protein product [Nippostrongylus brasiliensis]|uniref:Uncharacterized protein n=1 Tax=Nippostrongylus brasiliensis TaxID=27835 RepID=A0A0N4XIF5_NIPBR|nr:unnamed protein product [Nippostrongylus brasiliensis]
MTSTTMERLRPHTVQALKARGRALSEEWRCPVFPDGIHTPSSDKDEPPTEQDQHSSVPADPAAWELHLTPYSSLVMHE